MEITAAAGLVPATSDIAAKSLALEFDNFLILLTTQLRYQDPLEPLDSNEFTAQLVRFTNVEQAIAQNKKLEQLVNILQAAGAVAAVGYLGMKIEAMGTESELANGVAEWSYTLEKPSASTTIFVKNASGDVVFSAKGSTSAVQQTFTWDGEGTNGQVQPEGVYEIQVTAADQAGFPIAVTTTVSGVVTGVEMSNGQQVLAIGGAKVSLGSVLAVTQG